MSLLFSFNLDSFAMPLSFREIKTAAFTVPFLFSPLLPPLPRPVLFSANTRGTKMRTNQYSPTYLVIIICKKRNPWKNGSVPSFHSFPRTRRNLCHDRDSRTNRIQRFVVGETKEAASELVRLFQSRRVKFFARRICMHFLPESANRLESFELLRGITYRLISFSRLSPPQNKTTGIIVENSSSRRRFRRRTESVKAGI